MNICIVEDNDLVGRSLVRLCEVGGFETKCFSSSEALLNASEVKADCYVVDFRLPAMNGLELLNEIRAKGDDAPVVLMSGNFSPSTLDKVKQISNAICLNKPFQPNDFLELMKKISLSEPIG